MQVKEGVAESLVLVKAAPPRPGPASARHLRQTPDDQMAHKLTKEDVARLVADTSDQTRAETAGKVAAEFTEGELTDAEREQAEAIFQLMAQDVSVRVRESLSKNLQAAAGLSHDIALKLAQDVTSVALPILKSSEVLTDEDLIDIIQSQDSEKQTAIAQRPTVSTQVADTLIDTGNEKAVARLVANEGAELTERSFDRVMVEYSESEAVSDSLSRRNNMPVEVAERVVNAISERLESFLMNQSDLSPDKICNLIMQTRERATVDLVASGRTVTDIETLVAQLHKTGRLTSSLILRALCMGDLAFFEAAMACMAKVPVKNARLLIHDEGSLGLQSLYLKAGLPENLFPAIRVAVDVIRETDYDLKDNDRERFISRMLSRILTQYDDLAADDLDYLMDKLNQLAA